MSVRSFSGQSANRISTSSSLTVLRHRKSSAPAEKGEMREVSMRAREEVGGVRSATWREA